MRYLTKTTLLSFCLLQVNLVCSQTVFRGAVINKTTNKPIAGAKISVSEQGVGVFTNADGNFSYRKYHEVLDDNSTLKVTATGYKTLVNDKTVLTELINSRGVIYLEASSSETSNNQKQPSEIAIFWDASKKPRKRNTAAEINYLKSYLKDQNIVKVQLTIFNERIISEEEIIISENSINAFEQKLQAVEYAGYSDFDLVSTKNVDEVLIFTYAKPTIGNPAVDQETPINIINTNPDLITRDYFKTLTHFTSGVYVSELTGFIAEIIPTVPEKEIKGKVISTTGAPVNFALVTKEGSLKEYVTNEKGEFTLPASKNDEVIIYCLGYYPKRVVINDVENYNITLAPKTEILEEVLLTKKVMNFKVFDTIKNLDFTETGRRVPVRTMPKEHFRKNATDLADLIHGWAGVDMRINPRTGNYSFSVRYGCARMFVDGFEVPFVEAVSINTIVNISVYDGFGSVIPCPARILITTMYNEQYRAQDLFNNGVNPLTGNIYNELVATLNFNATNDEYINTSFKQKPTAEKLESYKSLRYDYIDRVDFYVDMALYFQNIDAGAASLVRSDFAQVVGENVKGLRILAYLNEHAGEFLKAEKVYKRIVELAPSQPQSYRDLALIYQETGEYQKSFELYLNMISDKIIGVDFSNLEASIDNELQRLVSLHKRQLDFTRLPNYWLTANFNIDVRMTLDWSDPNTPFEFQFVNPEKRFYNWNSNEEIDTKNKDLAQSQEFIVDDAASGKWLVNVRYTGSENEINIPPYLKYTIYKDYGTEKEEKTIKLVRLDTQIDKVTLDSFVY